MGAKVFSVTALDSQNHQRRIGRYIGRDEAEAMGKVPYSKMVLSAVEVLPRTQQKDQALRAQAEEFIKLSGTH